MKIGITQIILPKLSLDDTLRLCQEAGYQVVELVFGEERDLAVGMSDEQVRQVRQRCEAAGIEIGSVIASYTDGGNLLSPKAAEQARGKRRLARSLEIAGLLGVDSTLLHPGQLTVEGTYQQTWDRLQEILQEFMPVAAEKQVVIALENVWNKFLLSPREMAQFVDAIGSPWLGVYLDTANMMAYGFPEHWIRELGRRINRVHLKDFRRREHRFVPLMEGDTDWPTVIRELRAIGYDSYLIHEVGGDWNLQVEMARRMQQIVVLE